jgi:hypothetical protein
MMPSPIGVILEHATQLPLTHVSALWHMFAHPPQLLRSLAKATQAALAPEPHVFWPIGHAQVSL